MKKQVQLLAKLLFGPVLVWSIMFTTQHFLKAIPTIEANTCSSANCGGGTCPAGCPGMVYNIPYGGCFKGDDAGSLTCYDTSDPAVPVGTCDSGVSTTVPCPDSYPTDSPYYEPCPPPCDCDPYTDIYCTCDANDSNAGCNLSNGWSGVCFDSGENSGCINGQWCTVTNDGSECYETMVDVYCCDIQPTSPPPPPGATNTPPPGATSTPVPTATPIPVRQFIGHFYNDETATVTGLGGTDNLCAGLTDNPVLIDIDAPGSTVKATRTGEISNGVIIGEGYTIAVNSTNSDYTVALQLPFPPPDPDNAWQCACNADPADPYRCLYTNQKPSDLVNVSFFLKRANVADTAWFQTLGGSSWAANSISSLIPASTCTPPSCTPALIADDPNGTADSAGFPLTQNGSITTSATGETYIHEADARTTAVQGQATGVTVPTENYDYFYDKLENEIQVLASSDKPIVGSDLEVFKYTGNLTIDENGTWNVASNEKVVVFVDGNLTIDDTAGGENRIITVAKGGDAFLMFVVSGDINITANVGYNNIYTDPTQTDISNVEGVYVANGVFAVDGQEGVTDKKFIGAGTFVGWGGVELTRNFDDGTDPTLNDSAATETFIFRPDLLVNAPKAVKSAQMTWREVEPSFQ